MIRIDPSEIENWSNKPQAFHEFPELIRRLILATVPLPSRLRMPSGSSVRLPGWDGNLDVETGNMWVPGASSAWEFSCEKGVATKASTDYRKRTTDTKGLDASQTTYVFATPRQWSRKTRWVNERGSEGKWADVRVLDADDLAAWLEQAPAVAEWFARLVGKIPESGVVPLEEWWETWSSLTSPATTPELVVAGRDVQAIALGQWFKEPASRFYVQGATREEATAFLAACAIQQLKEWGAELFARALVVQTPEAWRSLERHATPLVLIRDFQDELVSTQIAISKGHHVLTPLGSPVELHGNGTELPLLGRDETVTALTEMGLSDTKARALSRRSARRLQVLRRFLIDEAGAQLPAWAVTPPDSLVALVLVGQWDGGHEGDKQIVAEIAGKPFEQVEQDLAKLLQSADAPLIKSGNLWRFVSHEEAWHLLAQQLTPSAVARFAKVAVEELGQVSPRFDLPVEEQHLANVKGKVLPHSETLREGVARCLALMGVEPDRAMLVDSVADVPLKVVFDLLAPETGWELWATLSDVLPILAEAAPDQFLDAVERDLSPDSCALKDLFGQSGSSILARAPYVGLLWALETLAWSKDHFSRVARILARLAEFEINGNQSPDPMGSLTSLFLPWIRFSETLDEQRLTTLKALVGRHPSVGFGLILGLYRPVGVTARRPPSWHPWGQDGAPAVTRGECSAYIGELDKVLLENVGADTGKWGDLLEAIANLSPGTQGEALKLLSQRVEDMQSDPSIRELWAKIRWELHRHRRYSHTPWALSKEDVEILDDCYMSLIPSDPIAANSWLFDGWVSLPDPTPYLPDGGVDHDQDRQQVAKARAVAIEHVYQSGGVTAILGLAEATKDPNQVGADFAEFIGLAEAVPLTLNHLQTTNPKHKQFAFAILRKLFLQSGWDGLATVLEQVKEMGSDPDTVATIYQVARPDGLETWERLGREKQEVQTSYWKSVPRGIAGLEVADNISFVAQHLVDVGRSLDAALLLEIAPGSPDAIILVLERLPMDLSPEEFKGFHGQFGFTIAELLKRLEETGSVSVDEIARLEIPYVGLLTYDRPELALHRQVLSTPSLFADLVSWVYKRSDDQVDEDVEESIRQSRSRMAFDLIFRLRGIPGQLENGTIDYETLENWVKEARRLCKERARESIGDLQIGQLLANAPVGTDGVWPCEPIRELLDLIGSHHLGEGFTMGKYNLRGVVSKGPYGGGDQEWSLAAHYRADAEKLSAQWPLTAKLLRELASGYESEGRFFDGLSDWREQFES